ncbi:MAG: tetratricopeptide repeat protein [Sutterella sp.]|nr:tetratricopeptide repeat protein [Sutterella sp.]
MKSPVRLCLASLALATLTLFTPLSMAAEVPSDEVLLRGLQTSTVPNKIETLLNQNQLNDALALADAGLRQNDKNLRIRFIRTVVLERLGREEEAIQELRRITGEFPEVPEPYNNLAVLLAKKGELNEAQTLLTKVLSIAPNFAIARKNLGDLYITKALNNYEEAAKTIKTNTQLNDRLATLRAWHDEPVKSSASDNHSQTPTSASGNSRKNDRPFVTEYEVEPKPITQ